MADSDGRMKVGLAKSDITPRVGVEMAGFGPFLLRRSIAVRDRLWARALVLELEGRRAVLVACDLLGLARPITQRIRSLISEATGVPPEAIMIHCTHTHSGPQIERDEPYLETLPQRIARAAIDAAGNLRAATLSHAEVPCEGIGQNREYDQDALPLEQVLDEAWRPAKPELTDTTCHVLRFDAEGETLGFASYFGCHPVVCCAETRYTHGDFVGVATDQIERDWPGSVGLFLQGAEGDVNSCVVHKPEAESMLALDVIASRYARAVRHGLAVARPVSVDALTWARREARFSMAARGVEEVQARLAEKEEVIHAPGALDYEPEVRMATAYVLGLRRLLQRIEAGEAEALCSEVQGIRLGPILLLGSPFETFQAIKNEVKSRTGVPLTLVMSQCNDSLGYAPDRVKAALSAEAGPGHYAAEIVPTLWGRFPFARVHDELVESLTALAAEL